MMMSFICSCRMITDVHGMAAAWITPVLGRESWALHRLRGCGRLQQGLLDSEDFLEQRTVAQHLPA